MFSQHTEGSGNRCGGQVVRRWSRKPKIMGSTPIHTLNRNLAVYVMFIILQWHHECHIYVVVIMFV